MLRALLVLALALPLVAAATAPPAWQQVGQARLRVMLWDVYDSTLYTLDGGFRDGQRPLRLSLRYLRDIRADSLLASTADEWDRQGMQHPRRAVWLEQLAALWPDISSGDELALVLGADGGSEFLHNGVALGGIDDPEFGARFIAIWLAPDTSRPELRRALLGGE